LESTSSEADAAASFRRYYEAMRRWRRFGGLVSILIAFAPALIAAAYSFWYAPPTYTAETRFEIRGLSDGPQLLTQAGGGSTSSSGGASSVSVGSSIGGGTNPMSNFGFVDGYAVRDFLQSRDAMRRLQEKMDLAKIFRVAGGSNDDALYNAYTAAVSVRYNMIEQILVLVVRAYDPGDTVAVSKALLQIADGFVNSLNTRVLKDAMAVAEKDLAAAQTRAALARARVTAWRNANANVDPTAEASLLMNLVAQSESQLSAVQADLALINASRAHAHPRRQALEIQLANLKRRIAETRRRLGGGDARDAANKIAAFEKLKAEQDFADSAMLFARQSVDQARVTMMRQQRYVSMISAPLASAAPSMTDKFTLIGEALIAGVALSFISSVLLGYLRDSLIAQNIAAEAATRTA
jgi:capsular polysaccharide transport system permease protein